MSYTVGIRELKQQTSAVLRRVVGGEAVTVTDHGHPIARIVPLRSSGIDQLAAEGRVIEAEGGDLLDLMDELELPVSSGSQMTASAEALEELRADKI